ncbi:MAG: AAA family ATPase [Muribaculaceae bacterium]|nr:AAA family ATPase [Muribaculaceae bacterium]
MEYKENGEASFHNGATPITNNFSGKDTNNSADMQVPAQSAYADLMDIVNNPTEPKKDSIFTARKASDWLKDAKKKPPIKPLWEAGWDVGEICFLFADANVGKSLLAVQIGLEIAKIQPILYFDFELSDRQFLMRYQDENGNIYPFPENFIRVQADLSKIEEDEDQTAVILEQIESLMIENDAKVLILDNLSFIMIEAEKGAEAGRFMRRLKDRFKDEHGWSVLILSHTPKRSLYNQITQNDLAGSKRLMNFVDTAVAIGQSAVDDSIKFVKTIKYRNGSFKYPSDSVLLGEIVKTNCFTGFLWKGTTTEKSQLRQTGENEDAKLIEKAKALQAEGKSQRVIADILRVSIGKVNKMLKS